MFSAFKKFLPWTFASTLLALSVVQAAVEIEHDPIDESAAGSRIELSAEVKDEDNGIELVRAYFKVPEAADYLYAEMQPLADEEHTYTATLPAPAQETTEVDYFLLVRNGDGEVVKSQNYSIEVTADAEHATELAALPPPDVVLEPSEFADVDGFHGKMLRMTGEVEVVDADGNAVSPADAGYVVRESQTIRTGTDGQVAVDFEQDPITVLDHNSRLRVRTPTWFTHLAGKAYFAFQRLLAVGRQERVVANTVALIGIRGTAFLSLEEDLRGVAVEEGSVNVASSADAPMQLTKDGTSSPVEGFQLEANHMATFDGVLVSDTPVTADVAADIRRLKNFAAGLLGAAVVAQARQSRVEVQSESANASTQGFSDSIRLGIAPQNSVLGLSAATSTVVAGTAGLSATTIGLIAAGAGVAVAAGGSSSSSGDGGSAVGQPPTDVSQITGSYTGSFSGTDFFEDGTTAPDSGPVTFTVSDGVMTVTNPLSGSGTVSASGSADFVAGSVGADGVSCNFNGAFLITESGGASADGTYNCDFDDGIERGTSSGTWNATRL
ncbi:MAG: FecR family protein [Gammaproteobacteria bacterium]|nr:FecR family protein [Gammaproteobacteria bacterium]